MKFVPRFVDFRDLLVRIRGVFFATSESRAEAHIGVAVDAAAIYVEVEKARAPRAARIVLRR